MESPGAFDSFVSVLTSRVDGVLAVATLARDGHVADLARVDPEFDASTIVEFATLVRIAERITLDAATGPLTATTFKTESAVILLQRIPPDRWLLVFGSRDIQAGLTRYLLSRSAPELALAAPATRSLRASN